MFHDNPRQLNQGFTLIELLVVITIIVVLLALLVPALDKAIVQAELARCAAQMKGIGTGVTTYAAENARRYPYRPGPANEVVLRSNSLLFSNSRQDDRPYLRGHVSMKMLADPLSDPVDLDHPPENPFTYIVASYNMWWSWHWFDSSNSTREPAMTRLGDRLSPPGYAPLKLLASDWYSVNSGQWAQLSHPDSAGAAYAQVFQDESLADPVGFAASAGASFTLTQWWADDASRLGLVDRNFLYTDTSVRRITDLRIDTASDEPDDRLIAVSARNDTASSPTLREHIPSD